MGFAQETGYQQQLLRREDEREHWREISRQAIYGDRFDNKLMVYGNKPLSFPSANALRSRLLGVLSVNPETDVMTVYVQVKNTAAEASNGVIVTDLLPDDLSSSGIPQKSATKQFVCQARIRTKFNISDLPVERKRFLSYNAIAKKSSRVSVTLS